MDLLTAELRAALLANGAARWRGATGHDPVPIVKFLNPVGAATWLATELDADGDTLFGLADLGFGFPELGSFSLVRSPHCACRSGSPSNVTKAFPSDEPLSLWADTARRTGSIIRVEAAIHAARPAPCHPLPPPDPEDG